MLTFTENEKEVREYFQHCWKKNPDLKRYPLEEWEKGLQTGKILFFTWKDKGFFRLNKDFKSFPMGTFFNDQVLVRGYPQIPRVYVLKTGLVRYMTSPFYAEEKVEGYNVRLFKVGDEILGFTRRGFICPFATDRWEDFLPNLPEFFEKHPNLVVCAEVAGPENPFVSEYPAYIKEDVNYFVFDFMKTGGGGFLSQSEKLNLLETYGFNAPEIYGPFDPVKDYENIRELLRRYHQEKREGVVFKSEDGKYRIKYVTPFSNLEDLRVVFPYLGEVDPHFIYLRLIRLALNLYEFEEFKEEVYNKLPVNLFEEVLSFFEKNQVVSETFRVRFKKESSYLAMLAHFRAAKINIEVKQVVKEKGYLKVEFVKLYPKATQFWRSKLEGWGEVD
jgi:putative ATP-dependent DNA ligase